MIRIGKVVVGSETNGSKNYCWEKIAQNQLEEAGKIIRSDDIARTAKKLEEYNRTRNRKVVRDNETLRNGEEVFLPLEFSMEEFEEAFKNLKKKAENARNTIKKAKTEADKEKAQAALDKVKKQFKRARRELRDLIEDCPEDAKDLEKELIKLNGQMLDIEDVLTNAKTSEKEMIKKNGQGYKKRVDMQSNREYYIDIRGKQIYITKGGRDIYQDSKGEFYYNKDEEKVYFSNRNTEFMKENSENALKQTAEFTKNIFSKKPNKQD